MSVSGSIGSDDRKSGDLGESQELIRDSSHRYTHTENQSIRFSEFVSSIIRSYQLQSRLSLALIISYHVLHLILFVVVVTSPLILRSLVFRDSNATRKLLILPNDSSDTTLTSVWFVDAIELTQRAPRSANIPLFHVEETNRERGKVHLINSKTASPLYISPLSVLLYYYFYLMGSFFIVSMLTRGRLTGHVSLLQLFIVFFELAWYVQCGPSSLTMTLWLGELSPHFPSPWVPYAKWQSSDQLSFHVYARNGGNNGGKLTLNKEIVSQNTSFTKLEDLVLYFSILFVTVLIGSLVLALQRVLNALVGVCPLDVTDGRRRCPICKEEWDLAAENPDSDHEDSSGDDELGHGVVKMRPVGPRKQPSSLNRASSLDLVTAGRHRCRRLFHEAETSSVFDVSCFTDTLEDEMSESHSDILGLPRETEEEKTRSAKKAIKPRVNRSFASPVSYGTMTADETTVQRALYDPFTDRQDEFRPGNAFPALEDATWLEKVTYSWLDSLMSFGILNGEVLRQERFLPSLPDTFTSLVNIASPAWLLWVNRCQWFGKGNGKGDDGTLFGSGAGGGGGDDDESSDDKTYVTICQRRPLTGAKLRAQRPKRSFMQNSLIFVSAPLRWLIGWAFLRFLVTDSGSTGDDWADHHETDVQWETSCEEDEGHIESRDSCASIDSWRVAARLRRNLDTEGVSLFTLFLDHRCGRRFVYVCVPLRIISDALGLTIPPIAYYLIAAMEKGGARDLHTSLQVCGILLIVLLARAVLHQEYLSKLYVTSIEACTAVKALVLEKSLALPLAQRTCSDGEVVHLMTVDASRCSRTLLLLHDAWASPCLAAGALGVLYLYVGTFPTIATLVAALVALPLQRAMGRAVHRAQQRQSASTVDRVELVGEAVGAMRQVKAMGAELLYLHRIHAARQAETRGEAAAVAAMAKAACVAEGVSVLLASVCYAAYYLAGGSLTASVVVPALVALGLVREALADWPALVVVVSRGYAAVRRIEAFMRQAPDEFLGTWVDLTTFEESEDLSQQRGTVICQNCSFTWQDDNTSVPLEPILRNVVMCIRPGELVVVQGPVGCGKSTLLLAVLGEVNRCCVVEERRTTDVEHQEQQSFATTAPTPSSIAAAAASAASTFTDIGPCASMQNASITSSVLTQIKCGRYDGQEQDSGGFAVFGRSVYCSEIPWLQNDTIRANIIADNGFNLRWYNTVTRACALHEDFEALDKGDATVVGDKGAQLSAGQQSRVALARALYSRADVYVFDSVLSSLDARLQGIIIERVFQGLLRQRTVILATHVGLSKLRPNRLFTVHENGAVEEVGLTQTTDATNLYAEECEEAVVESESSEDISEDTSESDGWLNNENDRVGTGRSRRERWGRSKAALRLFFISMGPALFWLTLSGIVQQVLLTSRDIWLSLWLSTHPVSPDGFLSLYFLVGAVAAAFTIPRMRLFFHAVRQSIDRIHFTAIEHLFLAPVSYFDVNAGSVFTGIFTRHQETADYSVGDSLNAVFMGVLQLIAMTLFNAIVNPWFILIIPLSIMLFYSVVKRYLAVSRQVQRLENRSVRGPVTILREALEGAPVIRCLGLSATIREQYCKSMDVSNTASLIGHMAECWMNLRLELLTVILTTTVATLGVVFASYMPPAFAGVAMVNCLYTSRTLLLLCRSVGSFQQQFVSVEQLIRLQEAPGEPLIVAKETPTPSLTSITIPIADVPVTCSDLTGEADFAMVPPEVEGGIEAFTTLGQNIIPQPESEPEPKPFPMQPLPEGERPVLLIKEVSARYRASLPYALRRVNLAVRRRERICVIGHSGSGKSTLFHLLLRLMDVVEGGDVLVDGVRAATIPYPVLRRQFMLIPQDPLIVRDTWRTNLLLLHPLAGAAALGMTERLAFTDAELWAALRIVKLDTFITARGGLDAVADAKRLGAGQRQRLFLARAILQRPPFLLLDELPYSSDGGVDAVVRRVLSHELRDSTVLLIARRVQTVETLCTRVVMMEKGAVVMVLDMTSDASASQKAARARLKKRLKCFIE